MFVPKAYPSNPELGGVTKCSVKSKSEYLRIYFEKIEGIFEEESDLLLDECKLEYERTKNHSDDSQYDYRAHESLKDIEFIYLRMHRYSAILTAYSYLESSMVKICGDLQVLRNISIEVSDINGEGIVRCRTYLEKLCGFDFNPVNSYWARLKTLNRIRNCIMHGNGDAERVRSSTRLIELIDNHDELSFIEDKLVMLSRRYVEESINDVEFFLSCLVDKSLEKK